MAFVASIRNSLRLPGLRNRLLFTGAMLLVLRIGAHIPVPGIDATQVAQLFETSGFLGLVDLFSGGAFRTMSIFAMGVVPYINSSIIVQLLTIVIPKLEELQKEGEQGRKVINQYMRYGTLVLALIQSFGTATYLRSTPGALINSTWGSIFLIMLSMTAGSCFLMWLGEQITEKGIGNGISLIILVNIVARLPATAGSITDLAKAGAIPGGWLTVIVLGVVALGIVAGTVFVTQGTRKIPVQYAKRVVGRRVYGGQQTYLPIKVNQAGVIPVIFAQSLLLFPVTIAQFFPAKGWAIFIGRWFDFQSWFYLVAYFSLNVFFTYFYTAITWNPTDVANNIKKQGGFILGIRPGKPTADYLAKVSDRITLVGGLFLASIAVLPNIVIAITGVKDAYLGGTALLIVVGVAIETMQQIEAHLVMRHYQGFLK